jgi:hypothetical protein
VATYGGIAIFGTGVEMRTVDLPRSVQDNTFFGIDGVEELDGGFRGRMTVVKGLLYAQTSFGLASVEGTFRSYLDGVVRDLTDTTGTTWPNVRLQSFQPNGRVRQAPDGTFFRSYLARFFHLT